MPFILLLLSTLFIVPTTAQTTNVYVIDGDTITLQGKKIRLIGIDAPELEQQCFNNKIGLNARNALIKMIQNKNIECIGENKDKYGRLLARCYADGLYLNQELVKTGNALPYYKYSTEFAFEALKAKHNKLGIWQNKECQSPWEYRKLK